MVPFRTPYEKLNEIAAMRKLSLILVCSIFLFPAISNAQDATELINKVKAKLATVKDYEAKGTMKTDVSFMKIPKAGVTIFYKNPNKFKIKKDDGISVMPKGGISVNLSSLLEHDNFTAVAAGTTTYQDKKLTVIKLLPLDEKSEVVVSTFYIDEKELLIRKTTTTTKDNGTYEMEMEYGSYAKWGLPDKVTFIFTTKNYKLPKGLAFDYDNGEKPKTGNDNQNQKGRIEINYSKYNINVGIMDSVFN